MTPLAAGAVWPDELTGIGTILLAIATLAAIITTVIITRQDRWIAECHLKRELAHSAAQLKDERDHARDHEQQVNAWAVRVETATVGGGLGIPSSVKRLVVNLTNGSTYPISAPAAKFSPEGKHLEDAIGRSPGLMPATTLSLVMAESDAPEVVYGDVLTPGNSMHLWTEVMPERLFRIPYGIVRWRDTWGQTWESKQGTVRKVSENEPWEP
jgi:hypothetical protein